jgi:hypothetical protein
MRYASARGFEIKAPFNNNLPPQTGDLIVNPINPVNPDSKRHAAARTRLNNTQCSSLIRIRTFFPYHSLDLQTKPTICHRDARYK